MSKKAKILVPDGLEPLGDTSNMRFFAHSDGIVVGTAIPGSHDDVAAAREKKKWMSAHFEKHGRCVLIIAMDGFTSQDRAARLEYRGDDDPLAPLGVCMLVRSQLARAIGNVLLAFARPVFPVKVSGCFDEAVVWAREILELHRASDDEGASP